MKIWTVTTDGDNCDLTTTAHTSLADAERRVREDLASKVEANDLTGDRLRQEWENAFDGACQIEEHEIDVQI